MRIKMLQGGKIQDVETGVTYDSLDAYTDAQVAARVAAARANARGLDPATMTNIQTKLDGTILTITMNLAHKGTKSSTGKTTTVASTHGNRAVDLPDGTRVYVGANAYIK